jgi:hypothetical protein
MVALYEVRSNPALHFTGALAQNAVTAVVSLPGLPRFGSLRYLLRAISVTAKEHFGPDLNFFSSASGLTTEPATDRFLSRFTFDADLGAQLGAAGLWRYYIDGLAIPYYDSDALAAGTSPLLHLTLGNVEATAKSAGAGGATGISVWVEPFFFGVS